MPIRHMDYSGLGERDPSKELSKYEFLIEIIRSLMSDPSKLSHPHSLRNLAPFSTSDHAQWAHWPSLSTSIQACVAARTIGSSVETSCFASIMHIKSTSILSSVIRWQLQWIEIANALILWGCSSKMDLKCANGMDVSFRGFWRAERIIVIKKSLREFWNFFCVVPFYEFVLVRGSIFSL